MKKIMLYTALACLMSANTFAQQDPNYGIIPAPVSIQKGNGTFEMDKTVKISARSEEARKIAELVNVFLVENFGTALRTDASDQDKVIEFTEEGADNLPKEGYNIVITPQKVKLIGKGRGLFYAAQSFMQLIPNKNYGKVSLPTLTINDYPRFQYRGSMLDVCRHFFPVEFVKKYIDVLAKYKINTFHWHLTDDQGWRIEIKRYPKLTEVGAWRNGTIQGNYPGTGGNDGLKHGGYYTQEQVKEVVKYATEHYIEVIPEIEMPGHASAAIAAYPELSCFPNEDTNTAKFPWGGSRKGKQVQQTWGVFEDVYVPTPYTFQFLQNVLDEVMPLFPSKYIHIGGDECPKDFWKKSDFCQKLIKEKGLKDEHGLQSYFIQTIEKHVNSKGKKIIGWDEILEGGLAPNATVMSWRGESGGITAAKQHHDVIMTPGSNGLYIDHGQSNFLGEPLNIGGAEPISQIYSYDPTPKALSEDEKKYILGVQANLWTEYIGTPAKVEYMVFPRLMALAEVAWTPLKNKDFKNFNEVRLGNHLYQLGKMGYNYRVPTPIGLPLLIDTVHTSKYKVELKAPVPGAKIYYNTYAVIKNPAGMNFNYKQLLEWNKQDYDPSPTDDEYTSPFEIEIPKGEVRVFKTLVVTEDGKRSVVSRTILNNGQLPTAKKTKK